MSKLNINPLDFNPNIGIGVKLPISRNNQTFFALNYTTADQLKTNLINLLNTEYGERYMLPTYGMSLKKRIFDNQSADFNDELLEHIKEVVDKWIPKIDIDNITIISSKDHLIKLEISFYIKPNYENIETISFESSIIK